ncbi:MAG TPA: hypothetical protein VK501_02440 [Baekduia sp.]|uniref:hypothetical protein n=1 Tax=Baekduia sp. TaxID=2600305 RepID=UPI002CB04550|nr:hypothetical protein [Baekduia sp.]HMJ32749.1 hypothetical protein [Baekduia sp.]
MTLEHEARSPSSRPGGGRGPIPALSVLLWLFATSLVALAPLVYFIAGVNDTATEGSRMLPALAVLLLAWPPLTLSIGLAHRRQRHSGGRITASAAARATLLLLVGATMLGIAHQLTISGDVAWTVYWTAAASAWLVLSRRCARAEPR